MANISVHPPLSNIQVELLKLFAVNIPESQLLELKSVMAKFLLEKARDSTQHFYQSTPLES